MKPLERVIRPREGLSTQAPLLPRINGLSDRGNGSMKFARFLITAAIVMAPAGAAYGQPGLPPGEPVPAPVFQDQVGPDGRLLGSRLRGRWGDVVRERTGTGYFTIDTMLMTRKDPFN